MSARTGSGCRLRVEALAPTVWHLGARVFAEILIEAADRRLDGPGTVRLLEDYTRISPEVLRLVGGDRFPTRLSTVPDDARAA